MNYTFTSDMQMSQDRLKSRYFPKGVVLQATYCYFRLDLVGYVWVFGNLVDTLQGMGLKGPHRVNRADLVDLFRTLFNMSKG